MTVIAKIDVSTPTGRRILRELKKYSKVVEINYTEPSDEELPDDLIPWEEAEEYLWNKLEEHYVRDTNSTN